MRETSKKRNLTSRVPALLLGASALYVLLALYAFPKWTVDDAYILYRYADNLAQRGELTWNVGEDPVEGYSGLALPLVLAVGIKAGLSPDLVSKTVGVGAFVASVVFLLLLLRRLKVGAVIGGITGSLYLTAPFVVPHMLAGLETMLFTSLVLLAILSLFSSLDREQASAKGESAFLGCALLLSVVRMEGAVISAALVGALLTIVWLRRGRSGWSTLALAVGLFVIPYLAYFLWRWSYYGQFFPNPYYAKSYPGRLNLYELKQLLLFSQKYLLLPAAIGGVLAWVGLGAIRKRMRTDGVRQLSRDRIIVYGAVLLAVVIILISYLKSYLSMNYSFRFFVPYFPLALVAIAVMCEIGASGTAASLAQSPKKKILLVSAVAAMLSGQLFIHVKDLRTEMAAAGRYKAMFDGCHVPTGKFLRRHVPSNEWLAVWAEAGVIPYLSRLKTIDLGALNDETLARKKLSKGQLADHFYSHNPGVFVATCVTLTAPNCGTIPRWITRDGRFARYRPCRMFVAPHWKKTFQLVFVRRDLWKRARCRPDFFPAAKGGTKHKGPSDAPSAKSAP